MPPRTWLILAGLGALGAALAFVTLRPLHEPDPTVAAPPAPHPSGSAEDFGHTARAYRIAAERPDLDRETITSELSRSDAVVAALRAEGVEDIDSEIHRRLNAVQPSEERMLAWFEAHPEHFGDRSYAQSREVLARLVAIEQVKTELLAMADSSAPDTSP